MKKLIATYTKLGISRGAIIGWSVAVILSWVIVCVSVVFYLTVQTMNKHNTDSQLASERANQLLLETMNVVQYYHTQTSQRDFYFFYASQLIENHYNTKQIPSSKRMSPHEISTFLKTIWDLQATGLYNGVTDVYLPLAFAATETDFVPSALGKAGERGLFQFMPNTAEYTSYKMGRIYEDGDEADIVISVYLWFNHYRHLFTRLKDSKDVFDWVSISYNAGLWTRGLLKSVDSGTSVDAYVKKYRDPSYIYHKQIRQYYKSYIDGLSEFKQDPAADR